MASGAKQQALGEDRGDAEGAATGGDAFAQLEKRKTDKAAQSERQARVEQLEQHSAQRWSDPHEVNRKMRATFRADKKARRAREERDASLRARIGWDDDRLLAGETSADAGDATPDVRREWHSLRAARRAESERRGAARRPLDMRRKESPLASANRTTQTLADRVLRGKRQP